jgi:hypothetical protein
MFVSTPKIQVVKVVAVARWIPWKTGLTVRRPSINDMLCLRSVYALDKLTAKAQKITIKLPWEITTLYSEVLRQSGHQSDDEEDEDDIEAHEASIQRLRVRMNSRPPKPVCDAYGTGSRRGHPPNDQRGVSTLF